MALHCQSPCDRPSNQVMNEISECCSRSSSRIKELLDEESAFRRCKDQVAFETRSQSYQLSLWRDRIAQWYYDVVDHLGLPRDIVFLAMNFLDRSVAVDGITRTVSKLEYELTSTTCLFLAIRISGKTEIKISELLQLSQSSLHIKDVQEDGARLLQRLSLKTPMISPATFIKSYLRHIHSFVSSECALELLETALYLVELSVCDHFFRGVPPSQLAFAAVSLCVTIDQAGPSVGSETQQTFMQGLQDETSLSLGSSEMKSIFNSLLATYNRSQEKDVIETPNIIPDELEHSSIRCEDSTESLVIMVPWTPTCSNLLTLSSSRPNKRTRHH